MVSPYVTVITYCWLTYAAMSVFSWLVGVPACTINSAIFPVDPKSPPVYANIAILLPLCAPAAPDVPPVNQSLTPTKLLAPLNVAIMAHFDVISTGSCSVDPAVIVPLLPDRSSRAPELSDAESATAAALAVANWPITQSVNA